MPVSAPTTIDQTSSDNPYQSKYGDEWRKHVSNSQKCKKFVSINTLIDHIFEASRDFFKGTVYEDDFFVYHDALSFMTSKESQNYCLQKGYRLILPQLGLNKGTIYNNRPVGNLPALMPMDAHLNKDIHQCVDFHVMLTKYLPDDDERKFTKRTPKLMAKSYKRIWDLSHGPNAGAPISKRIVEDINRVIDVTYLAIFNNRGRSLPNAAYNKGRRYCKSGQNWGGMRVRKKFDEENGAWIHPDAVEMRNNLFIRSRE